MSSANGNRFSVLRMTTGTADVFLAALLGVGVFSLGYGGFRPAATLQASGSPLAELVGIAVGTSLIAWILASRSRLDRRCAEDYTYQLMATGAMVGMFTMLVANIAWALDFVRDAIGLRGLRGEDMLAIGLVGWGVGYFTFRIRGLK